MVWWLLFDNYNKEPPKIVGSLWFGGYYSILVIRNPQKSSGNYLGPYSMVLGFKV